MIHEEKGPVYCIYILVVTSYNLLCCFILKLKRKGLLFMVFFSFCLFIMVSQVCVGVIRGQCDCVGVIRGLHVCDCVGVIWRPVRLYWCN